MPTEASGRADEGGGLPVVEIVKQFRFEAAHRLPHVPAGHKCGRLHGHSYRIELHLRGWLDPASGWVMDFGEVSAIVRPLLDQLDHVYLNEVPGLENPTSENLCLWLAARLAPNLPGLQAITVRETASSASRYELPGGARR